MSAEPSNRGEFGKCGAIEALIHFSTALLHNLEEEEEDQGQTLQESSPWIGRRKSIEIRSVTSRPGTAPTTKACT